MKLKLLTLAFLASFSALSQAADWSDTSVSVRYGTKFAEPFDNYEPSGERKDIKKTILNFSNATGFKYGTTFVSIDFLMSDKNDPGAGTTEGAQEVYGVFRTTLDAGKIIGKNLSYGIIRGYGVTAGLDLNTKNDTYGSKKRMLVLGPTLMLDVPGFLNLSALVFDESNAPNNPGVTANPNSRYHYDNHAAFEADWGIAVGSLPLTFNGYALFIASKGKDETIFHNQTAPETHIDADLMLDAGSLLGGPKKTALVGVEYEYWKNKFGNSDHGDQGAFARTPMIRAEYHF